MRPHLYTQSTASPKLWNSADPLPLPYLFSSSPLLSLNHQCAVYQGPVPANDEMEVELKSRFKGILKEAPRSSTFIELGSAPYEKSISVTTAAIQEACSRSEGQFVVTQVEDDNLGSFSEEPEAVFRIERRDPLGSAARSQSGGMPCALPAYHNIIWRTFAVSNSAIPNFASPPPPPSPASGHPWAQKPPLGRVPPLLGGGARWPLATYPCPFLEPFPSVCGGAHRPLTTLSPCLA